MTGIKRKYRRSLKSINCGDNNAWEICRKKGINLSKEVTRLVKYLAYGEFETKQQALAFLMLRLKMVDSEKIEKIKKVNMVYDYEKKEIAKEINKLQTEQ